MDYNGDSISDQEWDSADRDNIESEINNDDDFRRCPICGSGEIYDNFCYRCGTDL